ncbi:hypothetical protein MMC32_004671 [Xylographa parallela]|nr:hypothetical protein [Xylographa parallela]
MSSRAPSTHRPHPQAQHTTSDPGAPKAPPPMSSSGCSSDPPPKVTFTINTATTITGHRNTVIIPNACAGAQVQQARMAAVLTGGRQELPGLRGAPVELRDQYGVKVVGSGNLVIKGERVGAAAAAAAAEGVGTGTEHVRTSTGEYTAGMSGEKRRRV